MGQKKIKTIDLSNTKSSVSSEKPSGLSVAKKASKGGKTADEKKETLIKPKKQSLLKKKKIHSKRYKALKNKVNQQKFYPLTEAIEFLIKLANSKIDETVEVHLSTHEPKLTGQVKLPYGTGKKQKIVIANQKIIDNVSKGKIGFDILIASPDMMPKIAKVARILGPKGLMPNPKNGTITDKPQELKKKLEGGETRFKTEAKAPLIHMTIGKISFGKKKLSANLETFFKAVKPKNIYKATLTSTHSPGIKLDLTNI